MTRPLTAKKIEALIPADEPYEVADGGNGLRLRITPKGAKVFRWYVRSLNRVVTIGAWSAYPAAAHVTLAEARGWLERFKAARAAGVDKLDEVERELRDLLAPRLPNGPAPGGKTVAEVAKTFCRDVIDKQRKRPGEAREVLAKYVLPYLGALPLMAIKKSDCRAVVERAVTHGLSGRGAPAFAAKVLGLMKQLLKYAANVEEDFVSPISDLQGSYLGVTSNVRSRWLTAEEIPVFWRALDPDQPGALGRSVPEPATALALRLLLLTSARSAELRLARWADVDLEAATWTVPVANQKLTLKQARQAKPFVIPLPPTALALFKALNAKAGASEWVLASGTDGHYTDKALGRAMRRLWRTHPELKKLPEASPHDLRRTARTWLGKLGVSSDVAERCLNHALRGMARVYDQGDYFDERRAALEKWNACLERLITGESKVVFLPAKGA